MRKIKARVVTKDIKRLKMLTNGIKHVKHLEKPSTVAKRIKLSSEQVERRGEGKQAASSPVVYAQRQSVAAMQMQARIQASKQDTKPVGKKAYSAEQLQPAKRRIARYHADTPEMAEMLSAESHPRASRIPESV